MKKICFEFESEEAEGGKKKSSGQQKERQQRILSLMQEVSYGSMSQTAYMYVGQWVECTCMSFKSILNEVNNEWAAPSCTHMHIARPCVQTISSLTV